MTEYHKIQTAWLRDPATNHRTLIEGAWAKPEFEYLAGIPWTFTEKVDGTNIRIGVGAGAWTLGGKTDNAQLPASLVSPLNEIGERAAANPALSGMILYGEGYGAKIQKGGGNYIRDRSDFVLFDVWIEGIWLERTNVEDIAAQLGIRVVPIVGAGPLMVAIGMVRAGFASAWGDFPAEGLVMRPQVELSNRRGERIITKIKAKDF